MKVVALFVALVCLVVVAHAASPSLERMAKLTGAESALVQEASSVAVHRATVLGDGDEAVQTKDEANEEAKEEKKDVDGERIKLDKMQEFAKLKAAAEASAKTILAQAQAKAAELQKSGGAAASGSGSGCAKAGTPDCDDSDFGNLPQKAEDSVILRPELSSKDIPWHRLGLSDSMSTSQKEFVHAEIVAKIAEDDHDSFLWKHEKDCKGPICPLAGAQPEASYSQQDENNKLTTKA